MIRKNIRKPHFPLDMSGELSKICQLLSPERAIIPLVTYSHSTSNISYKCTSGQKEPVGSFSHVHPNTLIMLSWDTAPENILTLTRTQCPREVLPWVTSAVGWKEGMAACIPCILIESFSRNGPQPKKAASLGEAHSCCRRGQRTQLPWTQGRISEGPCQLYTFLWDELRPCLWLHCSPILPLMRFYFPYSSTVVDPEGKSNKLSARRSLSWRTQTNTSCIWQSFKSYTAQCLAYSLSSVFSYSSTKTWH